MMILGGANKGIWGKMHSVLWSKCVGTTAVEFLCLVFRIPLTLYILPTQAYLQLSLPFLISSYRCDLSPLKLTFCTYQLCWLWKQRKALITSFILPLNAVNNQAPTSRPENSSQELYVPKPAIPNVATWGWFLNWTNPHRRQWKNARKENPTMVAAEMLKLRLQKQNPKMKKCLGGSICLLLYTVYDFSTLKPNTNVKTTYQDI